MTVAIILSVYNEPTLLPRAIRSVQQQTFSDWNLILVDDGSTDSTRELVEKFAAEDCRIQVLRNQPRRGLAAALNRAWRTTNAEFIARMDADDEMHHERLEKQVAYMHAHLQIDVLGTGVWLVRDVEDTGVVSLRPESHAELSDKIYRETCFFHPTVMMRRAFLERFNGYDESLRFAQDADLWLRARHTATFANLRVPLLRYRYAAQPKVQRILWGTYVLFRSAWRERAAPMAYLLSARFLLAGLLLASGLFARRSGRV